MTADDVSRGPAPPYDRQVLVDVLVYHYRRDHASCGCGWAELGRSHPEHVATVYEESVAARSAGTGGRCPCVLNGAQPDTGNGVCKDCS